jgi:hypothetical protein
MLKGWFADIALAVSRCCHDRAEKLRLRAECWNKRAKLWADVGEWFSTFKSWSEIRSNRGDR